MEDKEKQIEEMVRDLYGELYYDIVEHLFDYEKIAKGIIKKGWIKLSEDSVVNTPTIQCETYSQNDMVVISREEYEHLKAKSTRIPIDKDGNFIEYAVYDTDRVLSKPEYRDYIYNKASKETAEKIAKYLFSICILEDIPHCMEKYFKKQFGVEIKE